MFALFALIPHPSSPFLSTCVAGLIICREHSTRKQVHRGDRGKIGSVFLFTVSFDYFSFDLIDKKVISYSPLILCCFSSPHEIVNIPFRFVSFRFMFDVLCLIRSKYVYLCSSSFPFYFFSFFFFFFLILLCIFRSRGFCIFLLFSLNCLSVSLSFNWMFLHYWI